MALKTSKVGDMKFKAPIKGEVSRIDAWVTKLIEATDDASIACKNAASTTYATLTLTKNSAIGTGFTNSPSADITFNAGDVLTFTTSKVTKGGKATIDIELLRLD